MEDPKASLDYSLVKLEKSRRQIGRSLVDVSAARTRLEHQRDELTAAAQRYADQAKVAVEAGRDDLARTALERKQE
ncbi:MAG: PspA/IM30 family protein, partial [Anaerolineae bacterium]